MIQVHPDDWTTWQELIKSIKDGQTANLASNKRRRALLAIAKAVDEMEQAQCLEVKT